MSSDITGVAAGSRESMGAASRETGLQTALVEDERSRLLDQDRARLQSRFRVLFIYATLCVTTFCVMPRYSLALFFLALSGSNSRGIMRLPLSSLPGIQLP